MSFNKDFIEAAMDVEEERSCSTESPKEYREAFSRAKKRRRTLKRKFESLDPRDVSPSSEENTMAFQVTSSRDSGKEYTVRIRNGDSGFRFFCNCGDQYGVPVRDHCRHVGNVITNMLSQYVKLSFRKPIASSKDAVKELNVTELESMFASFMQISERR